MDVTGAVDALPTLVPTETAPKRVRATGTDDNRTDSVESSPRSVAPAIVKTCQNVSQSGNLGDMNRPLKTPSGQEKTPQNIVLCGVFGSDADGARTRNLRIDRKH